MIGWRLGTTAWALRLLDVRHTSPRSYRENQSLLYRRQVQVKDSNTWQSLIDSMWGLQDDLFVVVSTNSVITTSLRTAALWKKFPEWVSCWYRKWIGTSLLHTSTSPPASAHRSNVCKSSSSTYSSTLLIFFRSSSYMSSTEWVSERVSGQRLNEGTGRLQERWYGLQVTQAVIVRPSDWAAASTGSSRSTAGFSTPSRIPQRSSYRRVAAYAWRLSTCGCCDWPSHKMIIIILMTSMMMMLSIIML